MPRAATDTTTYIPSFHGRSLGRNPVRPRPENVTLSWANGLQAKRSLVKNGVQTTDEFTFAGLFCDPHEDPLLDAAMEMVKTPKIKILHREGWAEHWAMPKCALHLLAEGYHGKGAMRDTQDRLGLAYGWRYSAEKKHDESYFRLWVLPQQLLGLYDKPLKLCLNSTATGDGLALLDRQMDVLTYAHEYLTACEMDTELPLWTYALPVGAPPDRVSRGQGVKSKEIYPIIALPARLDAGYLQRYEVKSEEVSDLLAKLSMQSVMWSTDLVKRLASGGEEVGN